MVQQWTEWGSTQVPSLVNTQPGYVRFHASEAAARRFASASGYKVVSRRVVAQDWIES